MQHLSHERSGGDGRASLATVLRERRMSLGLTIQQIEFDTKIRSRYITALEERDFDTLPVDLYLERILRNYAFYLGLDPKVALRLLKIDKDRYMRAKRYPGSFSDVNEMGELEAAEHFRSPLSTTSFVFTPRVVAVLCTGFAALLIGLYLTRLISDQVSAPELVIAEPQPGATVESNNVRVVGHAEPGALVSINNLVISVDERGDFQETLFLAPGTNRAIVRAEENGKVSERELVVESTITNTQQVAVGENVVLELAANAADQSWVRVIADGTSVFEGILSGSKTFEGKQVSLLAGNAGALDVTVNGVPQGKLGEEGEVVRRDFENTEAGDTEEVAS